jgi:methionyl-tRNA formyltransferase
MTDTNPVNIALFANHTPGVEIARFYAARAPRERIGALYVPGEQPENDGKIVDALNLDHARVFTGREVIRTKEHVEWFRAQAFDAIICVYWPWLLKEEIFSAAPVTVNFHPALLPVNRGWFPHVHSLIDGTKTGVTIHKIGAGADSGDLWAQKEVPIQPTDTARDIYERLQCEIVELFKDKWESIRDGRIQATPQDESLATYHGKKELDALDFIDADQSFKARDLINRLRARTFGSRGFAYYEDNGEKVFIKVSLSKSNKFE